MSPLAGVNRHCLWRVRLAQYPHAEIVAPDTNLKATPPTSIGGCTYRATVNERCVANHRIHIIPILSYIHELPRRHHMTNTRCRTVVDHDILKYASTRYGTYFCLISNCFAAAPAVVAISWKDRARAHSPILRPLCDIIGL